MQSGVDRFRRLVEDRAVAGASPTEVAAALGASDARALERTPGQFACAVQHGSSVRLARTLALPLRYFVAKLLHGPFLVVSDRIDSIFEWCASQRIAWQFDPLYTRMLPAHHLVELEQSGCPDPNPTCRRFFEPAVGNGPADCDELGAAYAAAALDALKRWLADVPPGERIALAFSGGIDSTAVLLLARRALAELGRDPDGLLAVTLDLGGGRDADQAERTIAELGLAGRWERLRPARDELDLELAIRAIEDYRPLDVECAAASLALCGELRARHPDVRWLLDGDGGDECWKSYPLEDSDLTLSSVLRNPLLYHEGWGLDAIKHSLTFSGGLSRSYVRTFAPARLAGLQAFSPFTDRAVVAAALRAPLERLAATPEALCGLKARAVPAGVEAATGARMPAAAKRRFQDGVRREDRAQARPSKAWCKRVFLAQWEERMRSATEKPWMRRSGNELAALPG